MSSTGIVTYSKVRAFLKKQSNIMAQYKSIVTMNEILTVTGNGVCTKRLF